MSPCARVRSLCFGLGLAGAVLGLTTGAATAGEPPAKVRPEVDEALARLAPGGSDVRVRRSRAGLLRFIAARRGPGFPLSSAKGATPEQRAHAFIAAHGAAFGLGQRPETKVRRVTPRDRVGLEHVRVQQMHYGIPVSGAEMTVHMDGDKVRAASSHLLDVALLADVDVSPTVSEANAQHIAANVVREAYGVAEPALAKPRLEIFNRGIFDHSDAPSRLAWFVEARAPRVREFVWVNAQDGTVLLHFNQVRHALNRTIYDASSSYPGVVVRTEGGSATGDADVDLLYAHLGDVYDYFVDQHRRDSFNGSGAAVVGVAHLPVDNAWWNDIDSRFEFGNGYPLADDVVAHEFTHAVDDFTADLFYSFEPGALSESFADIFGETVDLLNGAGNDSPEVRWLHGEDLPGGAGRSMMDPSLYGNPGRVSDPLFRCDWLDFYGVHYNSGVPSHAYALMVDGGTYNGRTIRGIGLDKAGHVAYRALTYLTSASGFEEASDAFQQACTDLVGQEGIVAADCTEVRLALEAVEMPNARSCHSVFVRVRQAGAGSGKVSLSRDPDSVDCSPTGACDAYFPEGESIRLSAVADPGSVFAGWSGDACTGTTGECKPFVTGDTMEIVAVFDPSGTAHPVTVTIGASAPGAVVSSSPAGISCGTDCAEVFPAGTVVTLSANVAAGYGIVRWGGDCSAAGVRSTCTLAVSGSQSVSIDFGPTPFGVATPLGSGLSYGGAEWGDYDADGDLDLVVVGEGRSTLYRNDGGTLVDSGTPLVTLKEDMAAAWGDYDNDGDLDLAVAGEDAARNKIAVLFRNDSGALVDSGMTLPAVGATRTLTWADYDNDGDLDLSASGDAWDHNEHSWVLRNDGGVLVDSGLALTASYDMEWGDYDADGDLDLIVAGTQPGGSDWHSTIHRNDEGTLVDSGIPVNFARNVAWIDYDNDGDLDLTLDSSPMLYQNQGGALTGVRDKIEPGWGFAWGDLDGDGGSDLLNLGVGPTMGERAHFLLLNQSGGVFSKVASGLPAGEGTPAVLGDYDDDGRLDVYLHSQGAIYRNTAGAANAPPQPPASTRAVVSADGVRLAWTAGSDARTPSTGLTYNVRVGTTPSGSEIVSAMADALTGRRFVVRAGNAGSNLFYVLKGLAPGRYYYTVQSIDTSFAGSGFSTTGTFDYPPAVSTSVEITSDWGTGYCADLTVTNISSSTVNGWQSAFALPGGSAVTITSMRNFQHTRDGAIVTLQPRWFNRTIPAGQSVSGGFCAAGATGSKYLLEVHKNGTGNGYVSANPLGIECGSDCSESYTGGTAVTLVATPAAGSTFLRWDGPCSGSATCVVTLAPGGSSVTAWFMHDTTGGATVTPVVAQSQPYYNEEQVRITNSTALTALSITIAIRKTTGLTFNGHYNTVGGQIQQSHTTAATTITYQFTLTPGQTVSAGTWTFAAQTNGTGTPHPTSGDTYSVTYTAGGQTYTQTGTF